MDFLFTGNLDGKSTLGLLYFCGQESDKHDGQLKRIAQPSLDFLHWLVTFQGDEIYYQRFVMLPKEDLVKINFPKHIIILNDSSNKITNFMKLKGNNDNIFDLLSILLHDHRNAEDELEAVDISYLLGNSKMCQDRFEDWLQNANLEHVRNTATIFFVQFFLIFQCFFQINETLELLKAGGQGSNLQRTKEYPTQWSDVNFKCVPLQEGEFVGAAEVS